MVDRPLADVDFDAACATGLAGRVAAWGRGYSLVTTDPWSRSAARPAGSKMEER